MRHELSPARLSQMQAWDALRRPIWVFDPNGLCGVYANPAALKLWGAATLEELLTRDFSRISPAVRARTARLAQATAEGGEIAERWTFYPNGEPITVQATISAFWLSDTRPVLLFEASSLEVEAEERRAVEALRHASTLITLRDTGGRVLFSNPAAFAAYGSDDGVFERRFSDPARAGALQERALAGQPASEVCRMITAAGERWHHLDARQVLDPVTGATGVLINEIDVTDRVEAEQAKAAAEQRTAMAEAQQRFLTDMSHELRTPLNAVIGFSDLLARGELKPEQHDQVVRIHVSGQRLLTVVDEMIRLGEAHGRGDPGKDAVVCQSDPSHFSAPLFAGGSDEPSDDTPIHVLCVDDNAHNRALIEAILTSQGIVCTTADDGDVGVELASRGGWNLILMDIQMPRMDGVQATRAIRALEDEAGKTPIVALTANTLPNQIASYLEAGMNHCLAKPLNISDLVDYIVFLDDQTTGRVRSMSAESAQLKLRPGGGGE